MQGSKIFPGRIYAISSPMHPNGLARFRVTAVVQRRTRDTGSPHDYETNVEGNIVEDQKPDKPTDIIEMNAKSILGPYEEQAELKARKDAEDAERERAKQEIEDRRLAVVAWLYAFTGVEPPVEESRYERHHFSRHYNGIEINDSGVRAILLKLRMMEKESKHEQTTV